MPDFNRSVLAIHAHPDDTEAFCAGTLALLQGRGYRVAIATMTAGGMGGISGSESETIAQRQQEARQAAAIIDADYHCLAQRDGYLFDHEAVRIATTTLIRSVEAGVVMTHLPNDYHSDHRTTCNIVEAASMLATLPNVPCRVAPLPRTPLLYHTAPLTLRDALGAPIAPPHFYVNIGDTISVKKQMLALHRSQIELMRVMHKMDDFFEEMKRYSSELGAKVGVDYAEVFWQHLGGGFHQEALLQQELGELVLRETA
ncbi:MAG: PIG-L family deacetylase [Proteobacteria bacterium]|nr:PIG-L family deacetylase [Pseudomonadota bacterium]